MELSVDSLRSAGGFTGGCVRRQVTWTNQDGEEITFDVHVRRLSYHTAVNDLKTISTHGDPAIYRLAYSIVDPTGKPIFSESDITGVDADGDPVMVEDEDGKLIERGALDSNLTTALLALIGEVNGLGKTRPKGKTSRRKRNSGTS